MANVLKFKSPHCIEWIVNVQSYPREKNFTSQSFILQDVTCKLLLQAHDSYQRNLSCESEIALNPAIDVIVCCTLKGNNSYNAYNDCKRIKFTGKRQIIWEKDYYADFVGVTSMTFEVFTPVVSISKGIIFQIFIFLKNTLLCCCEYFAR